MFRTTIAVKVDEKAEKTRLCNYYVFMMHKNASIKEKNIEKRIQFAAVVYLVPFIKI